MSIPVFDYREKNSACSNPSQPKNVRPHGGGEDVSTNAKLNPYHRQREHYFKLTDKSPNCKHALEILNWSCAYLMRNNAQYVKIKINRLYFQQRTLEDYSTEYQTAGI